MDSGSCPVSQLYLSMTVSANVLMAVEGISRTWNPWN